MTWLTKEIEYEGFPLLLRKPHHENIWQFEDTFPQLVSVQHHLEMRTSNGLPTPEYNDTLADFDHFMCALFANSTDGVIFLIETFGGKRNYYYYTKPSIDLNPLIKEVQERFNVRLTISSKLDLDWGFLDAYPIVIYEK